MCCGYSGLSPLFCFVCLAVQQNPCFQVPTCKRAPVGWTPVVLVRFYFSFPFFLVKQWIIVKFQTSPSSGWLYYENCSLLFIWGTLGYAGEGDGTPLQYSCLENPMDGGTSWAAVQVVAMSPTRLSKFAFTIHFHALKEMATYSSVLAWRIPGMGDPSGLPSMGLHRVGHDWSDLVAVGYALLMGVCDGTITLENSLTFSYKVKFISTIWLSNFIPIRLTKRKQQILGLNQEYS